MGDVELSCDYDPDVWLAIPSWWPFEGWQDPAAWARETASEVLTGSGVDDPQALQRTALTLQVLAERFPRPEHEDATYLRWRDVHALPYPVNVALVEADGEADAVLRELCSVDDPAAVEPPVVDEMQTAGLGTGLRTLRYLDDGEGLVVALVYCFRAAPGTYVRVATASQQPAEVLQALDDIDDLVRSLSVVGA